MSKTLYDSKWRSVWAGGSGAVPTDVRVGAKPAALSQLDAVQHDVNRRVWYRPDPVGVDAGDSWSTARETLARRSGDCEDYAIAKAQALLTVGYRPQDLYLVIGNNRASGARHAILVVAAAGKFWVLDNLSAGVIDADRFATFDPVITLSANRKWIHGYEKGVSQRRAAVQHRRSHALGASQLAAVIAAQSVRAPAWRTRL